MNTSKIALQAESDNGSLPWEQAQAERAREAALPWAALVTRDGLPPRSYILCGATRAEVEARIPANRMGPNGPVDDVMWLKTGP